MRHRRNFTLVARFVSPPASGDPRIWYFLAGTHKLGVSCLLMAKNAKFEVPPAGERLPHSWVVGEDFVICLTQEGVIPNPLWEEFLDQVREPQIKAVMGMTIGALTVSTHQRRRAVESFAGKRLSAVLETSVARGIATAMGWLGLNIKGFGWREVSNALEYLDRPSLDPDWGLVLIEELMDRSSAPTLEQMRER